MGSLRDLAQQALRSVEQPLEHQVEQLEHPDPAFHGDGSVPVVVEHQLWLESAKNGACSTVPLSRERNAGTLPTDLDQKLDNLWRMPCPAGVDPHVWQAVVRDSQRLRSEGWAAIALSLGWSVLDLFGAVQEKLGDPAADGLVVKMRGRPLLAICSSFATVRDGPGARSFLHRGNNNGAVLLWELGRTQRPHTSHILQHTSEKTK